MCDEGVMIYRTRSKTKAKHAKEREKLVWYRYRFFSSQEVMVIDIGSLKSKSLRRRKKGRRGDPDQKKKKV